MKITKNKDHYLFKNENGECHLSIEEYKKLGKHKAIEFAKSEINKKLNLKFEGNTINFKQARELGFCEYGIEDFCAKLNLDINKEYELSYIYKLLDESKLDLIFEYTYETLKLFGEYVFKKNEEAILKNSYYSYLYAKEVLKGPFEKGEEAISRVAYYSYLYARDVLKGPFEKVEEAISRVAYYSYLYARDVLGGSFKKGEKAISKDSFYSYLYAKEVLKGPFEKGEEAISRVAYCSYHYAKDILKGRFKKCEKVILNSAFKDDYLNFLKAKGIEL